MAAGCSSEAEAEGTDGSESELKTDDHRAITNEYCVRAGFHDAFCARVASEAFITDRIEWDHPWAHGMPRPGQGHCDAAAEVQQHLTRHGRQIRSIVARPSLGRRDLEELAQALGRALHALQDNCAHEGMTNPQHSWYSVRGFCSMSGEDPDTAPAALECAATETRLAFRAMKEVFRAAGKDPASLWQAPDMAAPNPGLDHVCQFLGEWSQFDGKDSRWDIGVTAPKLRETLTTAILTGDATPPLCEGLAAPAGGGSPIAVKRPRPPVTRVSDPTCLPIKVLCGL